MANNDNARGLMPIRHRNGAPYNGAANPYYLGTGETNNIFIGDPVVVSGTANTGGVALNDGDFQNQFQAGTLPAVALATAGAGNDITGVVVGVGAKPDSGLSNTYRPKSTEAVVWVADDPDLVFEVQEDSVTSTLAATDVARNVDLVAGTGSTTTGLSAWELDSNTAGTGSTKQCRIERLVNREDNEIGAQAKWEVSILQHSMRNKTGV